MNNEWVEQQVNVSLYLSLSNINLKNNLLELTRLLNRLSRFACIIITPFLEI